MYPRFIEVHDDEITFSLNVDAIQGISDNCVTMRSSESYRVNESYSNLKQLIKETGCLIHKADPRLDVTTPLTLDDLKGMVGEPVWNSNTGEWMLYEGLTDSGKMARFQLTGCSRKFVNEQELIKFPLYRMKQ